MAWRKGIRYVLSKNVCMEMMKLPSILVSKYKEYQYTIIILILEILGVRADNLTILKLTALRRGKEEGKEEAICSCQSCQTGSGDLNTNI